MMKRFGSGQGEKMDYDQTYNKEDNWANLYRNKIHKRALKKQTRKMLMPTLICFPPESLKDGSGHLLEKCMPPDMNVGSQNSDK